LILGLLVRPRSRQVKQVTPASIVRRGLARGDRLPNAPGSIKKHSASRVEPTLNANLLPEQGGAPLLEDVAEPATKRVSP
jgi:hypothetical protein